jgi:hypothetical protein
MNDPAMMVAVRDNLPRQADNLKIAKRERMALNIRVELSCTQTSHQRLPASAGGIAP